MSTKIDIEVTEQTLKRIVMEHFQNMLGDVVFELDDIKIQVKSKQNYKSEWEDASYRAVVCKCFNE